jgi:hypothetical protein
MLRHSVVNCKILHPQVGKNDRAGKNDPKHTKEDPIVNEAWRNKQNIPTCDGVRLLLLIIMGLIMIKIMRCNMRNMIIMRCRMITMVIMSRMMTRIIMRCKMITMIIIICRMLIRNSGTTRNAA